MTSTDEDAQRTALVKDLADGVAALGEHGALTIAEFSAAGLVRWDVRRDRGGTPRCSSRPPLPWSSLRDGDVLSDQKMLLALQVARPAAVVLVLSAGSGPVAAQAFDRLRPASPQAAAYRCPGSLGELLGEVLADVPLTRWYELVVLRRTTSGQLLLGTRQLFPPTSRRGERRPFTIQVGPADENGTVFAVVAVTPPRQFRLVSAHSASLAAGRYAVSAELRMPGLVRFDGLPRPLREDHRSWSELIASVPARLHLPQPAHLVCAIEVSGDGNQVSERLDRARQLVQRLEDEADNRLSVSVISYGPHSYVRPVPDEPPQILTWAQDGKAALHALEELDGRGAAETGYDRAAQLECVLTTVADRLTSQDGRPVLVTVGGRPAFPPRVDPSEIVPCPARRDWRTALGRLRGHHGITFGAIHDRGSDEEIWRHLGSGASGRLDVVDVRRFATELGLLDGAAHYFPFPLIEAEGE